MRHRFSAVTLVSAPSNIRRKHARRARQLLAKLHPSTPGPVIDTSTTGANAIGSAQPCNRCAYMAFTPPSEYLSGGRCRALVDSNAINVEALRDLKTVPMYTCAGKVVHSSDWFAYSYSLEQIFHAGAVNTHTFVTINLGRTVSRCNSPRISSVTVCLRCRTDSTDQLHG